MIDPVYKEALGVAVDDTSDMLTGKQTAYGLATTQGLIANMASREHTVSVTAADGSMQETPAEGSTAKQQTLHVTKKRSRKKAAEEPVQEPAYETPEVAVKKPIRVVITVGPLGSVPSQYVSVHAGHRVLELGLNEFSFTPAVADDNLQPVITTDITGDRQFIYLGQWFEDDDSVRHIILNEITTTTKEES